MSFVLKLIPMPVLYGVFLYMGVASLNGIQFFDRILLFFMPTKYQPDVPYLRGVELNRVHIFTGVQLASLAGLWVIKDIKQTSILFPLMLVVMMGVRKALDFFFSRHELKMLDDILPEHKRTERIEDEEQVYDVLYIDWLIFGGFSCPRFDDALFAVFCCLIVISFYSTLLYSFEHCNDTLQQDWRVA